MEKEAIITWIKGYVSRLLGVGQHEIETDVPFERYGLDSTAAAGLSGDLGELLGINLQENIVFHFPTIETLAEHAFSLTEQRKVAQRT